MSSSGDSCCHSGIGATHVIKNGRTGPLNSIPRTPSSAIVYSALCRGGIGDFYWTSPETTGKRTWRQERPKGQGLHRVRQHRHLDTAVFSPSISYQLAVLGTGTGFYLLLYSSLPASPPLLPTTCYNVCFGLPPDIENNLAIDENCATAIEKRLCVIGTAHEAIWSPKLMSDG
jgi:hypothetical protein